MVLMFGLYGVIWGSLDKVTTSFVKFECIQTILYAVRYLSVELMQYYTLLSNHDDYVDKL